MKVVIDRSKWNTGGRLGHARLFKDTVQDPDGNHLRSADNFCCLGFLGLACGCAPTDMLGVGFPRSVHSRQLFPQQLFAESSHTDSCGAGFSWQMAFADMNDSRKVDHATRESWIAEGFKTVLGVEVEFVGDYGDGT